jgi:dipeptidyl aminopeptidase/acylaminoacyl peptidase
VKSAYRIAAIGVVVLLGALRAAAQLPTDPEERAKVIAQIMQANARQLTLFDREGKELNSVGAKDLYAQPVFSPDAKHVAVIKNDLEKESSDLWVVDLATGNRIKITASGQRESASSPAWSPDSSRVGYVGLRQGAFGLYQKLSNGEGTEELLYKSNAPLVLTDWSMDGRYLTYYSTDLGGGALFRTKPERRNSTSGRSIQRQRQVPRRPQGLGSFPSKALKEWRFGGATAKRLISWLRTEVSYPFR